MVIDSTTGLAMLLPGLSPDAAVDELLAVGYPSEFCLAPTFDPAFISGLAGAGFLVMSAKGTDGSPLLLPKLHLLRAILEPGSIHEPRSVRRLLPRYELRVGDELEPILESCAKVHGEDWLTPDLRSSFLALSGNGRSAPTRAEFAGSGYLPSGAQPGIPRPLAFGLYREGKLIAGEFGFTVGSIYTSYSGYHGENSSGTVQLILTGRALARLGYLLWDLGMQMDYKEKLGARPVTRAEFIRLYRGARERKLPHEKA